jgi:hypothetical protein
MRLGSIVVVVALFVACARPSYFVRTGDAAYQRGEYARALKNYESEQRYRPSKDIDEKIAATKMKLVEQELEPIATAFADGRFDEGVTGLVHLDVEKREQPPVRAFVAKQEKRLSDELAARASRKEWGRAFVLARRAQKVFPGIAQKVPEYARQWADALRPAIEDADKKKEEGSAVILRAALAVVSGDASERERARRALVALRAKYALALEVRGKGDVQRVRSALAADPRFALSNANAKAGRVIVTLGAPTDATTTTRGREKARVQKGTRTAENPDYHAAMLHLEDKEDALAHQQRQKADELNSPSRTKESVEGYDYPIRVAQADVDEARENLRNTPTTIQEPNFVDVEFEVETHTLTVARDVSVDVEASWKGDLASVRENVKLTKRDKAHAANSEANLARDPVALPAPSALAPELDRAVATWLDGALTKVATQYYRALAGGMSRGGMALVIALYPRGAQRNHRKELEKELGVPMGDSLVDALANDRLDVAFDEPEGAKPAVATATKKPAAVQAKPGGTKPAAPEVKPTAVATPPTPPVAPADPMLAKAGYALTIAPFTFQRTGKVVLEVKPDGTLTSGATKIAVLRSNGTVEDLQGRIMLAISKNGDVWMPRQQGPSGRLAGGSLSFDRGATVTIDNAGRVTIEANGTRKVSEAALSPSNAKTKPLALLVAWLGLGKLGIRNAK